MLLPFSLIYGIVVWLRNWLFDKNILKSAEFNFPVICVGNLAVGGTGKTPMVEYLIRLLKHEYLIATISRGYKRKSKGFGIANENTTALEIGDEPMQFHKKFPDITVAVGEERLVAIPHLLQERPNTEVIILDDAFQHRSVKAGLYILLTEYKDLYTRDFPMPGGDLRDVRSSAQRAEIIIVTKCNSDLPAKESDDIVDELELEPSQSVYFSSIIYGTPYHLFSKQQTILSEYKELLLICGIANPKPLKDFLTSQVHSYDMISYPDHHIFDSEDLLDIKKHFEKIKSEKKIIITTEKDGVRLQKFEPELATYPVYVLPIEHAILFNKAPEFHQKVIGFINSFKK